MGQSEIKAALSGLRGQIHKADKFRNDTFSWAVCTVEDAFAHTGCYLVRFPAGPMVAAVDLVHTSGLPMGARPIGGYPPRSRVLVLYSPMLETAIIVGAVAKQLANPDTILPDSIALRSCVGIVQDPMHYTNVVQVSGIGNFSLGRPLDTLPGDWGSINELGMAIALGKLVALLRASDLAKVEAFWGDDLLRLTGYNFELYSAAREEHRLDDEGEFADVALSTPFIWEGAGIKAPGTASRTNKTPVKAGNYFATVEPFKDDQLIIPREVRLRGYLGDIERKWVCAPPEGVSVETFSRTTPPYTGLSEMTRHIDGTVSIRSAREIILEKTIKIPVPKVVKSAEDPQGDNRTNYKAAGLNDPQAKKEPFIWGSDEANIRSVQAIDESIWFHNRFAAVGLGLHKKDWYLPEEREISSVGAGTFYSKQLNAGHQFLLPLSDFASIVIDHRQGHQVRFYRTRSGLRLHDDGSVTIEDGYGSQIKMTGGAIFLTAVNDVWIQPGRSAVVWAPFDAIVRAGNCADLTAAKGDVRIKAEKNLQILSGNSGSGGCVIENRATNPSAASGYANTGAQVVGAGITLKAAESSIHSFSKQLYLGVKPDDAGSVVTLDGGEGTLFLRGKNLTERLTGARVTLFASETEPDKRVLYVGKRLVMISSSLEVGGSTRIVPVQGNGSLEVSGSLKVHGGGIFGKGVATNGSFAQAKGGIFVGKMKTAIDFGTPPAALAAQMREQIEVVGGPVETLNTAIGENPDTSPANAEFQRKVGVSMRSTQDMRLGESFVLYESRWQQIVRVKGGGRTWDEPEVKDPQGNPTRPHPGQEAWEGEHYKTVDPVNYESGNGEAKDRQQVVPNGAVPQAKALKDGYVINVQE